MSGYVTSANYFYFDKLAKSISHSMYRSSLKIWEINPTTLGTISIFNDIKKGEII